MVNNNYLIGTYKLITGIRVTHKVGSNDDSEMVSPRPPLDIRR